MFFILLKDLLMLIMLLKLKQIYLDFIFYEVLKSIYFFLFGGVFKNECFYYQKIFGINIILLSL